MDLNDKQKKIIEILTNDKLATTKISFLISANLYQTEQYLNELEKEGLILKEEKNYSTYWSLKNVKDRKSR